MSNQPGFSVAEPLSGLESTAALDPTKVGMIAFLVTEASFFGTLIMAYVYFLSQSKAGSPSPARFFICHLSWPHRFACSRAARRSIWRKKR